MMKGKKAKLLVPRDSAVLRGVSQEVPVQEIESKQIRDVINKMKEALHAEDDGVAIAAPQIGVGLRIFVVNSAALAVMEQEESGEPIDKSEDLVFINPEVIKVSQKKRKMEEGCLSLRYLYGEVDRHEKITITAYDDKGIKATYGGAGLMAQIFQHEIDHLDGILFIDKAENVHNVPPVEKRQGVKFVFFGSSRFSDHVLEELERAGFSPAMKITSAKDVLPIEKLKKLDADVFVVASFGKILPKELIELPKFGTLNVHPSLLPELRGASPIQNTILGKGEPGVTIIKMDEKMDHGPMLAQEAVTVEPWPDHYNVVEEKLGRIGGALLAAVMPKWIAGEIKAKEQKHDQTTFTKLIKKEDGLLDLEDSPEKNLRKVLAYSTWPGAYLFFKSKTGKEIRVVVKDAKVEEGKFIPTRVVPAGKKEMDWQSFLRGNA
jgi:peptide deformylase